MESWNHLLNIQYLVSITPSIKLGQESITCIEQTHYSIRSISYFLGTQ